MPWTKGLRLIALQTLRHIFSQDGGGKVEKPTTRSTGTGVSTEMGHCGPTPLSVCCLRWLRRFGRIRQGSSWYARIGKGIGGGRTSKTWWWTKCFSQKVKRFSEHPARVLEAPSGVCGHTSWMVREVTQRRPLCFASRKGVKSSRSHSQLPLGSRKIASEKKSLGNTVL